MRQRARTDANQAAIVAALRGVGATVQHTHTIGRGCVDILVGFRGQNYALEIKEGTDKLTPDEEDWHRRWKGQVSIVRTPDEALAAIGAIEPLDAAS